MTDKITTDQIQELHDFLSEGILPKDILMSHPPKLGPHKAMSIIWYLQEHLGILPDNFEMCGQRNCNRIINTDCEGEYSEKTFKHYCDGCAANRRFRGQRI